MVHAVLLRVAVIDCCLSLFSPTLPTTTRSSSWQSGDSSWQTLQTPLSCYLDSTDSLRVALPWRYRRRLRYHRSAVVVSRHWIIVACRLTFVVDVAVVDGRQHLIIISSNINAYQVPSADRYSGVPREVLAKIILFSCTYLEQKDLYPTAWFPTKGVRTRYNWKVLFFLIPLYGEMARTLVLLLLSTGM